MHLKNIKAVNFRNYDSLSVKLSAKMNAFLGLNGMGKTNALDAIYYLCIGKSYFSSGDRHGLKKGKDFFRIEGKFEKDNKEFTMVAKVIPAKLKQLELNQKRYAKLSEHLGKFPCVIIAPSDILMLIEGSAERRRLIDQCISQYDTSYLNDLMIYTRLLNQRNSLLKSFKEARTTNQTLLDAFTEGMKKAAQNIYNIRASFAKELSVKFKKHYKNISNDAEQCSIEYKSDLADNELDELFEMNLEKDLILARTTSGIHKDDLLFYLGEEKLKPYASQGQLKSFILSLKLAEYDIIKRESQCLPILLLDDLFDKLDDIRTNELLKLLSQDEFGQIFISDTHQIRIPEMLKDLNIDSNIFIVSNGKIVNYEEEEE